MDESDRRIIDFSPAVIKELLRFTTALFPVVGPRVVITSGGWFMRTLFKLVKTALPRMDLGAVELIARDEVLALVEDARDVPAFWLRDHRGRAYSPRDRKNIWCYERCLQDTGKITTKDVFNPGPWPYAETEAADVLEDFPSAKASSMDSRGRVLLPKDAHVSRQLDTIVEGSADDTW